MPPVVELSVVVPVYGCATSLEALEERVRTVLEGLGVHYELVLVDDASPDDAWPLLRRLAADDGRVRAFRLSRNFGQHAAITAGLAKSRGRWVVVLDCDLQDPPEEIPRLYAKAQEGFDIVFGRRREQSSVAWRRAAGGLYFRLLNVFLGTSYEAGFGSFSIVSRKVVDAFLEVGDQSRQYLLILHWLGFDHAVIEYDQQERHSGPSSYSWKRLIQHAMDGVFFQSTTLMRWLVYAGFAVALSGLVLTLVFIGLWFGANPPPGWTSLAVLLLVLMGFVIVSLGVTGLYIGKIFEQVRGRPLYVVAEEAAAVPAVEPVDTAAP
jgi:polyisoprenyl-phosphate glycosyltransferase